MAEKKTHPGRLQRIALVACLAAVSFVYSGMTGSGDVMTAAAKRELPVYNVDTQEKVLSISFDAAWGSAHTEKILDILDEYDVRTTFFLVGFWSEKYPELVQEIVLRGHEIGNHSATHPHMSKLSEAQIKEELKKASDLVEHITGKPTTLFRPPYGEYNDAVVRVSRDEGYECVQWNVDSLDWKFQNTDRIVRRVEKDVKDGDIILMHDIFPTSVEAALRIVDDLQKRGYEFVTVEELLVD